LLGEPENLHSDVSALALCFLLSGVNRFLFILACCMLTGCVSTSPKPEAKNDPEPARQYEPASASALAFDLPIFAGYELPGLDRAAREPGAYMGYQETTVESYSSGFEDHQSNIPSQSYYDRWNSSVKTSTLYR
jgi:hypothetical protein